MFAVIKTGGKQYRVTTEEEITVDHLEGQEGDQVIFDSILIVGGDKVEVGAPLVEGASVSGRLVRQARGPKIIAFKKRRRKHSQRSRGHRQDLSVVKIEEILTGGAKPSKAAAKPKAEAKPAKAEKAPKAEQETKKAASKAEAAPTEAKASSAKLTDLKGVGPAAAKKLEDAGLTIEAIAAWSAEDMARFDADLDLKGKPEKDDWIGQAKALLG